MKYTMIIEKADGNYSAYLPDVPGCVATGKTPEKVRSALEEALILHIRGLAEDNLPIPLPSVVIDYVAVPEDMIKGT